ncbi:MAG: invasion associated locus B family protein [Litorimonas sp.]
MKHIVMKRFLPALALCGLISAPAWANEPQLEGVFNDWTVYSLKQSGDKSCYAVAKPQSQTPQNVNHGDVRFLVSNWKSGAAKEQPSFLAGYPLKTTRAPKARVGSSAITMYASENEAFIESGSDERSLVGKMRAGASMRVQAVSARGTETSYQFSLKGITAALRKAKSACQ